MPTTQVFPYDARAAVSLIKGEDRRKNVTAALVAMDPEIRPALKRKKYVVIKVNNVVTTNQLAATHIDSIRGILDYLEPRFKGQVVIVESSMEDTLQGFEHYKYADVVPEYKRFNIKLIDLNREARSETFCIVDQNVRPVPIRMAARLMDPDAYIISAAMLKTHNAVVATMTVKNMAMGAPLHSVAGQTPVWHDKRLMHAMNMGPGRGGGMQGRGGAPGAAAPGGAMPGGMPGGMQARGAAPQGAAPPSGAPPAGAMAQTGRGAGGTRGGAPAARGAMYHAMNYNVAMVAKKLSATWGCGVIDGFEGMEGNGPMNGDAVPMHVALASPDLVAADRVGLDLMGIPHHAVGYLQYAGELGAGQFDIAKIDVRGEKPEALQRKFKLHPQVQQQLDWLNSIVQQG
ncbi:MAG TPA: DUF362 domain-containing protein [Bryobacteraceae bacterium]|nr:DUF362 domain-containing protein [Bryobacteraceae bacterium]